MQYAATLTSRIDKTWSITMDIETVIMLVAAVGTLLSGLSAAGNFLRRYARTWKTKPTTEPNSINPYAQFSNRLFWPAFVSAMWPSVLALAVNAGSAVALTALRLPLTPVVAFSIVAGVGLAQVVAALSLIALHDRWRNFEFPQ